MSTSIPSPPRPGRVLRGIVAALAVTALAGCSGSPAHVTVTVPPPAPSSSSTPTPSGAPANPGGGAAVGDGTPSIVVTQGEVATECTHSVCYHVHVAWTNFDPGPHETQCVTDAADLATWSQSKYNYPTADGERDLGCFLGYPGSHVWVIIDGTLESPHAAWG